MDSRYILTAFTRSYCYDKYYAPQYCGINDNGVFVLENNQLLPFERNRYYIGKLLTSADFQAEQSYGIQKRRFLNEMMFGSGIVCGLGVYSLDDLSIMIDSGVAVDGLGHEVVVDTSIVRKLSAIDGFDDLPHNDATLCLAYQEESVHPVYSVRGQESGEGYECNRIREGYRLFLQATDSLPCGGMMESEFLNTATLYEDSNWSVSLSIPSRVSCGEQVRMSAVISRTGEGSGNISITSILQTPTLLGTSGEHELSLQLTDISLSAGECCTREYWFTAQSQQAEESLIIAGVDSTRIEIDGIAKLLEDNFMMKVSVDSAPISALLDQAVGRISLEMQEMVGHLSFIPLAQIKLQRSKNSYLIDGIVESGVKQYIRTNANASLREAYATWFGGKQSSAAPTVAPAKEQERSEAARYPEPVYASGVCEIPLDSGARRGQTFYSDEVLHGLGKGNIYVKVGFEYLGEDAKLGALSRNTIYGDPQLFATEAPPIAYATTAVKVMNDRGSFVAAAQLTRDTTLAVLTMRWVAIRLPVGEEQTKLQRLSGKSISAAQPTVVLATRETHFFNVKFKNMEPCTLTYELTEPDSGEITSDGIYTAPAKEGVYEIRISCADMPLISTYAYAVVKKRNAEQEAAQA